eukprot:CAMPEP_0174328276 /NCGR_PEP_ID=MMETSP0810-20121108/15035_1 /TAXON_ID=73025 ORGANISM="Eutreptiella gymnastica-like, Strain CCMP1594" /NCGR_SAMPLE_ID=MMETSP0810 /ASSEMBLY_ACC=CAM_ASM_000659 /LENGTH=64 /DNA_ID=CAMNT_0015442321 /DNA_START=24 /DNA_END=216 /DNA_ORIENTATION=+
MYAKGGTLAQPTQGEEGLQEGKELPDQEIKGTMVLGTTVPSGGHWAPLLGATSIHLGAMPPPPP